MSVKESMWAVLTSYNRVCVGVQLGVNLQISFHLLVMNATLIV